MKPYGWEDVIFFFFLAIYFPGEVQPDSASLLLSPTVFIAGGWSNWETNEWPWTCQGHGNKPSVPLDIYLGQNTEDAPGREAQTPSIWGWGQRCKVAWSLSLLQWEPSAGSSTSESKQASETTCAAMITLGHWCAMDTTRPSHPELSGVGATHTTFWTQCLAQSKWRMHAGSWCWEAGVSANN